MIRNGLIAAAFVALAIIAAVGWTRKTQTNPATPAATNYAQPAYASQPASATQPAYEQPASPASPASYDAYGQPVSGSPAYGAPAANATLASNPCVDSYGNPVGYQQGVYAPGNGYVSDRYVESIHRPVVVRRADYVERYRGGYSYADREVVHHRRSTGKSVAIVAGSAAGGAAIGALAGGGKGAGIGALVGGAGGFIYDRLTHNH